MTATATQLVSLRVHML